MIEFERLAREMQLKYERKLGELRDELNEQRKNEVTEIEQRKNAQIKVHGNGVSHSVPSLLITLVFALFFFFSLFLFS